MVGLIAAGQGTAADIGVGALIGGRAGTGRARAPRCRARAGDAAPRRDPSRCARRDAIRRASRRGSGGRRRAHGVAERRGPLRSAGRPGALRGFVHEAVKRVAIDGFRTAHAQRRGGGAVPAALDEDVIPGKSPDPEAQAIAREQHGAARPRFAAVTRTASVVLRVLRGEPQNEIAASLGRHPSQVTRPWCSVSSPGSEARDDRCARFWAISKPKSSEAIMTCEWRAALPLLCRIILCAPRTFKNLPAENAALAHVVRPKEGLATRRASSRARSSSRWIPRAGPHCAGNGARSAGGVSSTYRGWTAGSPPGAGQG